MAKDNEYPYKHRHVAIKRGHATFYGEGEPSKELLEALNKMAELAYEQCGGVKVDTGENNALLPDVVFSEADPCKYFPCNYNGTKACGYPYCPKYTKGEAEVCQHSETYDKVRFCTVIRRCKKCDSFWQT
jgi:hypothetical protein